MEKLILKSMLWCSAGMDDELAAAFINDLKDSHELNLEELKNRRK